MRRRKHSKKDEFIPCNHSIKDAFIPFCPVKGVKITDTCIVEVDGCFFLLVALESDVPKVCINTIVSIAISEEQACKLLRAGVRECCIFEDKDEFDCDCIEVCFKCIIVLKGQAFKVFIIEGEIVLIATPICSSSC